MKKFSLVLMLAVVMLLGVCFEAVSSDREHTYEAISKLNTLPGAPVSSDWIIVSDTSASESKKFSARDLAFNTNFFLSGHSSGATIVASEVTPLTAVHLAFGYIQIANGTRGIHPLPDGVAEGKTITLSLLANPGYLIGNDGDLSMVKTGWSSIFFDDAGDAITLVWIDSTVGWIITANNGCVVTL